MERPSSSRKKISKNVVIAIAVIAIVFVALAAGEIMGLLANQSSDSPTPTPTASPSPAATPTTSGSTPNPGSAPYDFKIFPENLNMTLTQGGFQIDTITLSTISGDVKSISPNDVIWNVDSGSSGIQVSSNSTSITYEGMTSMFPTIFGKGIPTGFSRLFTITVPSSIPTDNYPMTLTVRVGSVSHSIPMLVSVKSATVTVSGTVNVGNSGMTPYQIEFINMAHSNYNPYIESLTDNTYSITMPSGVYFVRVNDGTALDHSGLWHNVDTFFEAEVPVGSTSMTHDFTIPNS